MPTGLKLMIFGQSLAKLLLKIQELSGMIPNRKKLVYIFFLKIKEIHL